ncbi:MAG: FAD-dependent oxidoreductase [Rhodobacterales bacterium]|nr:FAD-dependent oxidoreductase [Rhodobacterales bacterium]
MADVDVVVIGSGAGGLTAALGCALTGKKVLIIEQHYLPGGWCHSFPLGGHQYSPGVHYIGALEEGGQMRKLYEGMGLAKHLTFLELNPDGYDHVWIGDDFKFDIPRGFGVFKDRLKAYFPHESKGIDSYMDTILALQQELMAGMGKKQRMRDALKFPFNAPNVTRWGLRPLSHLMDKYLTDPMLKAVLSIQAGDHGLPASRAPAALHASVAAHYFKGGWYPKGGAAAIPRAYLREIKALGGDIMLETTVSKILTDKGKVTGVRLADGTEISAPVVISNADPEITFRRLMDENDLSWTLRRKLRKTKYSLSNISLFAAVDMDLEAMGYDSGKYW